MEAAHFFAPMDGQMAQMIINELDLGITRELNSRNEFKAKQLQVIKDSIEQGKTEFHRKWEAHLRVKYSRSENGKPVSAN
jgi:hypothetical protein